VFKNILPQGHQIMFGIMLGAMILFVPAGLLPLLAQPFRSGPQRQSNAASA
jgi:branched-chain amino acid transport system permease protein